MFRFPVVAVDVGEEGIEEEEGNEAPLNEAAVNDFLHIEVRRGGEGLLIMSIDGVYGYGLLLNMRQRQ